MTEIVTAVLLILVFVHGCRKRQGIRNQLIKSLEVSGELAKIVHRQGIRIERLEKNPAITWNQEKNCYE